MTSLSFIDCCRLLAVDPKTLRQWLAQAQIVPHSHPTDARIKCLTSEQIHTLATLHGRVLPFAPDVLPSAAALANPDEAPSQPAPPDADLQARLMQMEAQVATLQAQLTDLALQLLQEQTAHAEHRPHSLETSVPLVQEASFPPQTHAVPRDVQRRPHPSELRVHSRLTSLIEYAAGGTYVGVCPQQGVLSLVPDSPEWFDWLASLTSFRFVGQQGRFLANRGNKHAQQTRSWIARRTIHGRPYTHYLGVTDHLTIECLEQGAAFLQSHLTQH